MILFHTSNVAEAASKLNELFDKPTFAYLPLWAWALDKKKSERVQHYRILKIGTVGTNRAISAYLKQRGILAETIRSRAVKEIYYEIEDEAGKKKRYFGAGGINDTDGADIRSEYVKSAYSKRTC